MQLPTHEVIIVLTFIWCGLVIGISFIESWIKFRAPGVTLATGLAIGRIVFAALNKTEWIIAIIIVAGLFLTGFEISFNKIPIGVAIIILLMQTLWLLPALDARATAIITNSVPRKSQLHIYFVAGEFVKVISLIISGIIFLN